MLGYSAGVARGAKLPWFRAGSGSMLLMINKYVVVTIPARLDVYRPQLLRHRIACYAACAAGESWFCCTAAGVWNPCRSMSQVVDLPKDQQRLAQLFDGVKGAQPQEVLLQGSNEAFGAAVALGGSHEGRRALDAEEGKLLLEGVGQVLAPVIVPHRQTARDLLGES